jgi:ubiquinone/menaquinone biosynthesis C-methylase UbiE
LENEKQLSPEETSGPETVYFDMLAEMDFTKHLGGIAATRELIELCYIEQDKYVLEVGCGVGVTPCYIAKKYGCRVVGVDSHDGMIARAKERAIRERVADRTEFRVADARDLPFEDDLFDVVMCESVLAFVEDKQKAINEYVRVAKPGGYVGLSESAWIRTPSPKLRAYLDRSLSQMEALPPEGWEELLVSAGLRDVVARTHELTVRSEFVNRLRRMGFRNFIRIWGRALSVLVTKPAYRNFVGEALSEPKELIAYWGYGTYVGRK